MRTATAPWWGWGTRPARLASAVADLVAQLERIAPSREIATIAPALPDADGATLARLRDRLGEIVRDDPDTRARHAIGQSYRELALAQRGIVHDPPLAVLTPASHDAVRESLAACAALGVAVVPFGGGTSVTGGVAGIGDPHVALSLRGLASLRAVDPTSLIATADAGMRGPELEAALAAQGLTLGHFPQSFERATVGGWVATRSAGQFSTGIGAIAELTRGLRAVAPAGEIDIAAVPPSAEGPDLLQMIVGSEGRYAVITDVSLRVRPAPERTDGAGWMFASFADGVEAVRGFMRDGPVPDLVRLSDEIETGVVARANGALLLCGAMGESAAVDASLMRISERNGRHAKPLGPTPYARWAETRYDAPFLRDALIERGFIADSLETSALWTDVLTVHRAVREALARALDRQGRALVLCHLSHAYPTGASLYFTFVAPGGEDAVERWWSAKRAALDAMVANGGTASHHHGIGRDHRDWQARRLGGTGMRAIDAVAQALDPDRVLAANR